MTLPARRGRDAGHPIRLPPVGAALGRGGVHGLRLGDGFLRPLRVGGLRRPTFSRARESRQRVRIGAVAPMYPRGAMYGEGL